MKFRFLESRVVGEPIAESRVVGEPSFSGYCTAWPCPTTRFFPVPPGHWLASSLVQHASIRHVWQNCNPSEAAPDDATEAPARTPITGRTLAEGRGATPALLSLLSSLRNLSKRWDMVVVVVHQISQECRCRRHRRHRRHRRLFLCLKYGVCRYALDRIKKRKP